MKTKDFDVHHHPCFNAEAKGQFGRVHLPVAPKCNIKCNYCNRKYDCTNESRPGVTSKVLSPHQALAYMEKVLELEPRISVAGIAGPGDPLANPGATLETLRLIRERFPGLILCLATNGLALPAYVDDLASLSVSHVTVTINAIDPKIGSQIYAWVRDGKVVYRGERGAGLLLERQLEGVTALKEKGIMVKVNTIVVPGINEEHVIQVAEKMASLGVDLFNCIPMYPTRETPFEDIAEPDPVLISRLRDQAARYLPQMRHCTRCRADAVGLLGEDRAKELASCLRACATLPLKGDEDRPYVAVATREGLLVNLHLGEAASFQIWRRTESGGFEPVEERPAPRPGGGLKRWLTLSEILKDCRAVLVAGLGENPRQVLEEAGIKAYEMTGFIEEGLKAVYEGGAPGLFKARRQGCSGGCRGGGGLGCL
ncbi:nitrogenase cofactor biosynthesis protein NifB [Thermosulfuriphilus ammonigenes]|uniref:FeMo cofactor biosynthesis protein NifB n=1 Tax=Thermosulfuriphilus ammonigenes TaxID=1936021 RepID=A0A6G7PUQ3_9BACT|nr:nitrogenase cofactor biosynthesis protein NifB [Thermosulfuriphilus ammonigenes]MBA2848610.1 nitrogen fixation protein NifB [Thermosulfuriphilus ammonigenes]QIJ71251.1 nitrogenase cofactor biosynthesis protein NifB [Thermosulfuriphilus ammonigenes]